MGFICLFVAFSIKLGEYVRGDTMRETDTLLPMVSGIKKLKKHASSPDKLTCV